MVRTHGPRGFGVRTLPCGSERRVLERIHHRGTSTFFGKTAWLADRYRGAKRDIQNAIEATAVGGLIILDDMNPGGQTRRAFDEAGSGRLKNVTCVENVPMAVSHKRPRSSTAVLDRRTLY